MRMLYYEALNNATNESDDDAELDEERITDVRCNTVSHSLIALDPTV